MNHGAVAFPGTLLDWFAGQAMTAITISALSKNTKTGYTIDKPDFLECLSLDAYAHAEAMIKVKGRYYVDKMVEDHSPDAGKMIPDPFAEDALRQLASDVLPADIKEAASEERLTWCAEQVRAQVNTLEAQNQELLERIKQLSEAGNDLVWWFCQEEESQLSPAQASALKRWRDLRGRRNT